MKRFLLKLTFILMLVFAAGCSGAPPKPVLPDGSHRVPVNVAARSATAQGASK